MLTQRRGFIKGMALLPIAIAAAGSARAARPLDAADDPQGSPLPPENAIEVTSAGGMVVGTTGAQAQIIGTRILKQGGSAVDAAIATAMAQITLAGGSWVSFAGLSEMVYFEAESATVSNMNGCFNTVRAETDYKGVPTIGLSALSKTARPGHFNGRTVAVPGFMRGVETAHRRYGKLSWSQLIAPSIDLAERGFTVNKGLASQFLFRAKILSRFPESKAVVFKENDATYGEGDLFKQPALAMTLRRVADQGASYMYTGAWAEKFVTAVRGIGGRITMEDLADYKAMWVDPVRGSYKEYDIHAHGLPAYGGVNIIEAMQLLEAAHLGAEGEYTQSANALYWLSHITRSGNDRLSSGDADERAAYLRQRLTKEHARSLWEKIKADGGFYHRLEEYAPRHSDGVVVVDAKGDMAALMHSINTVSFGETGLIIDGVSVSDSLTNQLDVAANTKPGSRLPDPGAPLVITRDGKAFGAFSAIGAGLHQRLTGVLYDVLQFQMTPQQALNKPSLGMTIRFGPFGRYLQTIGSGRIDPEVAERLKEMGLNLVYDAKMSGYVAGITIDPNSKVRHGGTIAKFGGRAVGF
jgi:gamma-glutamyltranspeptidase / glutathione hydrolase